MLAVDRTDGTTVAASSPDRALPPASNTKLVTAGLALEHLGADYRYETRVVGTGPASAGTLDGDLVLVGVGAPDFDSADLDSLAADVGESVERVGGDVVVDGTAFADGHLAPGWTHGDRRYGYGAPSSGVALEGNQVTVTVSAANGEEPSVTVAPDTPAVTVDADVTVDAEATDEDLSAHTDPESGTIRLRGDVPPTEEGIERTVPVTRPEYHCGLALRSALEAAGVAVDGDVRVRKSAEEANGDGATLATVESAPVRELAREMNVPSDNFVAEQFARTVARSVAGEGTWSAWESLVREHFETLGVDTVRFRDGSGLSRYNLVPARALVAHLQWADDRPWAAAFFDSLPEPGEGTLSSRLDGVPVAAKTGTITGTCALSGVVRREAASDVFFSVVQGGMTRTESDEARETQDAFLEWLTEARDGR